MLFSFCDIEQRGEYIGSFNLNNFSNVNKLVHSFKHHYNYIYNNGLSEPLILIILSQPDQEELNVLLECTWDDVFFRQGIRGGKLIFSSSQELNRLIKIADNEYKERRLNNYLLNFKFYSDEELDKLSELSGRPLEKLFLDANLINSKPQKNSLMKSKINVNCYESTLKTPGKLITFRGSNNDFLVIYSALKKSKNRMLFIDGDLLVPSFDNLMKIPVSTNDMGINNFLSILDRGLGPEESFKNSLYKISKNIHIMAGNYNIYNYEHYKKEQFESIINTSASHYDLTIIKISNSLYDEFSMLATHRADLNIICVGKDKNEIRYFYQLYSNLCDRQQISKLRLNIYKNFGFGLDYIMSLFFKQSYKGLLKKPHKMYKILSRRLQLK